MGFEVLLDSAQVSCSSFALGDSRSPGAGRPHVVVAAVELDGVEGADGIGEGARSSQIALDEGDAAGAVEVDGGKGEVRHGSR